MKNVNHKALTRNQKWMSFRDQNAALSKTSRAEIISNPRWDVFLAKTKKIIESSSELVRQDKRLAEVDPQELYVTSFPYKRKPKITRRSIRIQNGDFNKLCGRKPKFQIEIRNGRSWEVNLLLWVGVCKERSEHRIFFQSTTCWCCWWHLSTVAWLCR